MSDVQDQLSAELGSLSARFFELGEALDLRLGKLLERFDYTVEIDNLDDKEGHGYVKDTFCLLFGSMPSIEELRAAVVLGLKNRNWWTVADLVERDEMALNDRVKGHEGSLRVSRRRGLDDKAASS